MPARALLRKAWRSCAAAACTSGWVAITVSSTSARLRSTVSREPATAASAAASSSRAWASSSLEMAPVAARSLRRAKSSRTRFRVTWRAFRSACAPSTLRYRPRVWRTVLARLASACCSATEVSDGSRCTSSWPP
ncbi:hypothetical protein G6F31_013305 [Rhizopus arrhizus]|nr:hypothetical protein G6F31_013305 [Rhizopus arrhizus]